MTPFLQLKAKPLDPKIISTAPTTLEDTESGHDESDIEARLLVVDVLHDGHRIDKYLSDALPEFSRSYLQQLVQQGDVRMGDQMVSKVSAKVQCGRQVLVHLRPTESARSFKPETLPLDIVFEDDELLLLNKPAGMVVHPAPGNWSGTVMNALLAHHSGARDLPRAGIVHRLDKDTSGLMVVAKTRRTMDALVRLIASRGVHRLYLALTEKPLLFAGVKVVDQPIGRDPRHRLRMAVHPLGSTSAKTATTRVKVLREADGLVLVGCKLDTGRTHQIRVHMAWLGAPLVGDVVYGGRAMSGMNRQALHATRLEFVHPVTGCALSFTATLPADMQAALSSKGLHYNCSELSPRCFAPSGD